jgi:hypothetical protein
LCCLSTPRLAQRLQNQAPQSYHSGRYQILTGAPDRAAGKKGTMIRLGYVAVSASKHILFMGKAPSAICV